MLKRLTRLFHRLPHRVAFHEAVLCFSCKAIYPGSPDLPCPFCQSVVVVSMRQERTEMLAELGEVSKLVLHQQSLRRSSTPNDSLSLTSIRPLRGEEQGSAHGKK